MISVDKLVGEKLFCLGSFEPGLFSLLPLDLCLS